ncbi:MAG: 7-cyano-7-deazaguanine synthase, partial [Planctomycetota bacterium]
MNIRNKPSNKSTVRIAMIGCGAIAECYHLPALKQHAATRDSIVLVDPNQSRTAQLAGQFNIAHCSADYRALTDDIDVPKGRESFEDIPVTYVPARNTVFLSLALAYA